MLQTRRQAVYPKRTRCAKPNVHQDRVSADMIFVIANLVSKVTNATKLFLLGGPWQLWVSRYFWLFSALLSLDCCILWAWFFSVNVNIYNMLNVQWSFQSLDRQELWIHVNVTCTFWISVLIVFLFEFIQNPRGCSELLSGHGENWIHAHPSRSLETQCWELTRTEVVHSA